MLAPPGSLRDTFTAAAPSTKDERAGLGQPAALPAAQRGGAGWGRSRLAGMLEAKAKRDLQVRQGPREGGALSLAAPARALGQLQPLLAACPRECVG